MGEQCVYCYVLRPSVYMYMYIHVYMYMHVLCRSDTDGGGTTVVVRDVMGTEGQVEGLTPGALYTFSVTAENAVSSQDSDVTGRTTNATAITEDGGKAAHECKLMVCSAYTEQGRSKVIQTTKKSNTINMYMLGSFFLLHLSKMYIAYAHTVHYNTLCIMRCYYAFDNKQPALYMHTRCERSKPSSRTNGMIFLLYLYIYIRVIHRVSPYTAHAWRYAQT